jgi:hypothetical protein
VKGEEYRKLLRAAERGGGGLAVVDGPMYFDWAKTHLLKIRMKAEEGGLGCSTAPTSAPPSPDQRRGDLGIADT